MKKTVVRILLQALLMLSAVAACVGIGMLTFSVLPDDGAIFAAFFGWIGLGLVWQECAEWLDARLRP